jgi:hypothetical protein
LREIQLAGDGADRLPFVEDQPDGPRLELVSELPACARAGFGSDMRDIVSTFRNVSTEPDQAQRPYTGEGGEQVEVLRVLYIIENTATVR